MKWTPGPWKVVDDLDIASGPLPGIPAGIDVATCGTAINEFYATALANARLIAAAPSMAALLQRIVADLPANRDWLDPAVERHVRQLLKDLEG